MVCSNFHSTRVCKLCLFLFAQFIVPYHLFEAAKEKPMILVLDEYPYLREVVRGMDSVLQALVDRYRDRIESIPYAFMINKLFLY